MKFDRSPIENSIAYDSRETSNFTKTKTNCPIKIPGSVNIKSYSTDKRIMRVDKK